MGNTFRLDIESFVQDCLDIWPESGSAASRTLALSMFGCAWVPVSTEVSDEKETIGYQGVLWMGKRDVEIPRARYFSGHHVYDYPDAPHVPIVPEPYVFYVQITRREWRPICETMNPPSKYLWEASQIPLLEVSPNSAAGLTPEDALISLADLNARVLPRPDCWRRAVERLDSREQLEFVRRITEERFLSLMRLKKWW